jgi:hypothetical protein
MESQVFSSGWTWKGGFSREFAVQVFSRYGRQFLPQSRKKLDPKILRRIGWIIRERQHGHSRGDHAADGREGSR